MATQTREDAQTLANTLAKQLIQRALVLEQEIDALHGQRYGGAESRSTPADPDVKLLGALRSFPRDFIEGVELRASRSSRPEALVPVLRQGFAQLARAGALVHDWFGTFQHDAIPSSLSQAVQDTFQALGIRDRKAVVTGAAPDKLDIVVTDALRAFEGSATANGFSPANSTLRSSAEAAYAVLRVPTHEAENPTWWPILLGHECAHQRLGIDEQTWASEPEEVSIPGLERTPRAARLLLEKLGVLTRFPFDAMREALLSEQAGRSSTSTPPDLGEVDVARGGGPNLVTEAEEADHATVALAARVGIANNWAREVACDLYMVRRFGPAGVAAMAGFISATSNYAIQSESHPPGFMRISIMLRALGALAIPSVFDEVLRPWLPELSGQPHAGVRGALAGWAALLCEYIEQIQPELESLAAEWQPQRYDMAESRRQGSAVLAVRQLAFGIPPFSAQLSSFPCDPEFALFDGDQALEYPVEVEDLINAGWIAVELQRRTHPELHIKVPIAKLLLKGLEDVQVAARQRDAASADPGFIGTGANQSQVGPDDVIPTGSYPTTGAILGAPEISDRLRTGNLAQRIIVTTRFREPLTDASVDLRLGKRFIVFQRSSLTSFSSVNSTNPRAVQKLIERPFGSPFVLHPNEVVLAGALEYLALPGDVAAQVITRSSYGRLGLITATAVHVHPFYRGCLTLELVNLSNVPMELYPGERVAQLVFFSVSGQAPHTPSPEERFRGTYVCPTGPEFPHFKPDGFLNALLGGPSATV